MVGRSVSRDIGADPHALWTLVADVTRMAEWSPENEGAEWLDGGTGPVVGARFRGRNRRGRARWSTTCEVVASEPGRELAFTARVWRMPRTLWRYRFEPLAPGRTRVTESYELPRLTSTVTGLLRRVTRGGMDRQAELEHGMRTTLEQLESAARARSPG